MLITDNALSVVGDGLEGGCGARGGRGRAGLDRTSVDAPPTPARREITGDLVRHRRRLGVSLAVRR